jgi:alanyl-tRNA synthetase
MKDGKVILHLLDDVSGLKVGAIVECRLNDARRIQLMQHHTSTHIVNASAKAVLGPHVWQAGAHKSEESSRLDITHYKAVSQEELKMIEDKANEAVGRAYPVDVKWMRRNEAEAKYGMRLYQGGAVPGTELRIVDIVGLDTEACGGTHLKNTREAGQIKLLSAKRIQDGVVRLEFTAGSASKREATAEGKLSGEVKAKLGITSNDSIDLQKVADVFSVQAKQLPGTIDRFLKENAENSQAIIRAGGSPKPVDETDKVLEKSLSLFAAWKANRKAAEGLTGLDNRIVSDIASLFEKSDTAKYYTEGMNVKTLSELANKSVGGSQGRLLIVVNGVGDKVNVVVASSGKLNAGDVCKRLSALLGGGGGGKPNLAMGGGDSKDARKVLEEFNP